MKVTELIIYLTFYFLIGFSAYFSNSLMPLLLLMVAPEIIIRSDK